MEKKFIYADLFIGFQTKLSELTAALRAMHKCEKVTEVERRAVHTKQVELLGLYNDMLTEVQILKEHGTEPLKVDLTDKETLSGISEQADKLRREVDKHGLDFCTAMLFLNTAAIKANIALIEAGK